MIRIGSVVYTGPCGIIGREAGRNEGEASRDSGSARGMSCEFSGRGEYSLSRRDIGIFGTTAVVLVIVVCSKENLIFSMVAEEEKENMREVEKAILITKKTLRMSVQRMAP